MSDVPRTSVEARIASFLARGPWGVAGASNDRLKFGNRVLRCYLRNGKSPVYPLNPRADTIEGLRAYPDLAALPERVISLSIVTPPEVTETLVVQAAAHGVRSIWMQPGAESTAAVEEAEALGIEVIAGGPCLLVELG